MISSLFFMIRKPIDLLRDKALHSVKKRLHLLSQTDMSLCDFSFPRVLIGRDLFGGATAGLNDGSTRVVGFVIFRLREKKKCALFEDL